MKKKKKPGPKRGPGLSPREKRFIDEYLVSLNGRQAAIAAGYGEKGAHVRASSLLKKPTVRAAVDQAMAARSKRTEITQDRVLEELYFLLTSNVDDYEGGDGETPLHVRPGVDPRRMRAVSSVKKRILMASDEARLESVEFRLWEKPRAIVTAMRHLGMLNDKLTINLDEELKKVVSNAAGDFERGIAGVFARLAKSGTSE